MNSNRQVSPQDLKSFASKALILVLLGGAGIEIIAQTSQRNEAESRISTLAEHVALGFMTNQRRATRQWPHDLTSFSTYLDQQYDLDYWDEATERPQLAPLASQLKLRIIRTDRYHCFFRLYFPDHVLNCRSYVDTRTPNNDNGVCEAMSAHPARTGFILPPFL